MDSLKLVDLAKLTTVLAQGLITGTAYYITMVEVPARLALDMPLAVKSWKPCFNGAKNSQIFWSTFSMLGGFIVYYLEYGTPKECILWPIASAMVVSIVPYTLIGMMPLNNQLVETQKCIEKGDRWIEGSLKKWGSLHAVRTVINLGAFGLMLYATFKSTK
ncbi:uncharacterized protein LOC135685783 [Rhopilema esculentum]|uniref:uncharacterized protein LOC135685783 n=1 Tax=Rhopilema esculentum TaxID=499914 RepID=UPI0031D3284B|eukprot:gene17591-9230_t